MGYAIILDIDGDGADPRVRREYERRLPRLDRRYVWDYRVEEVRALAKGESADEILAAGDSGDLALLFFEAREASAHFVGDHIYRRTSGRDQILGYSIRTPESLLRILERLEGEAFDAVEKARKREARRRAPRCDETAHYRSEG